MQGQKGASQASTRKIHRRLTKRLTEFRAIAERRRKRPGYDESKCLTAETVRIIERWLSGESVPVGVLKGPWRQVCTEAKERAG